MGPNDTAVFERWYGKEVMRSEAYISEKLKDDDMYDALYNAFEEGLERGQLYNGKGECCAP